MNASQPLISVDVVPLQRDPDGGVNVILGARLFEPFLGELALPGVLLQHELVREAAGRALRDKTGITDHASLVDAGVFDNPDRDPRGPTLSIAHLAALSPGTDHGANGRAMPLHEATGLPFDHDSIVRAGAKALLRELWQDKAVTQHFMGETFSTRDAVQTQKALLASTGVGSAIDASNLSRKIAGTGWVTRTRASGDVGSSGGRPPAVWAWA